MRRWPCILLVLVAACGDDGSGGVFGNTSVMIDGVDQPLRHAWMYPMRGAPIGNTEKNLGWTITFTRTSVPHCTNTSYPPLYVEVWTAEKLADAVEGTATLPTDADINIEPGIVTFPSQLFGEGFFGTQEVLGKLRLTAFAPTTMSGTLEGYAIEDGRMPISHTLAISFETSACP